MASRSCIGASLAGSATETSFDVAIDVDADRYPWLRDHSINEVAVVPAMLVLEWFNRAARAHRPDLTVVECHDLRVLRGIQLADFPHTAERFTVRGHETARPEGVALALDLLSRDGTRHYSVVVEMRPEAAAHEAGGAWKHAEPLDASPWHTPDLYDGVLFHGPALQVLQSVEGVSSEGIAGMLADTVGLEGQGSWELDVAALDGGLQLGHRLGHASHGAPLPADSCRSFRQLRGGTFSGPVRCRLRGTAVTEHRTLSQIVFEDAEGRYLAELTDVEMHMLVAAS